MTRFEEIAARCEAATPGPMVALSSIPNPRIVKESDFYNPLATIMGSKDYGGREYHQAVADANFFAHSREDIPWLQSEIARLEIELAQYKQDIADGWMVALPIWGNVYIKHNGQVQEMKVVHYSGNGMGVYTMRCECVDQHEDCDAICGNENEKACAYQFRVAEIGKTVFPTRETALEATEARSESLCM